MKPTLDEKQKKVAWELSNKDLTGLTIRQIAEEHGIDERTIYRWKNDPHFATELERLADIGMKAFYSDSMQELRRLITKGHSEQARLGAVKLVLQSQGKLRDVQEVVSTNTHDISGGLSVEEIRGLREYLNEDNTDTTNE